jgi:hypothetical protein
MQELICLAKLFKYLKGCKKSPGHEILQSTRSDTKQNKENVCPFSILQCRLIKELETKKWISKLAVKILAAHHRLT